MTTIATWNLNSLRARGSALFSWLDEHRPDVVALQETRVSDEDFPYRALKERGYHALHSSSGGYAGVAILARSELSDARSDLRGEPEAAAGRILRATVAGLRLVNVYVPTRKAIGKVEWLSMLRHDLRATEKLEAALVLCGDFNTCFDERDAWDPLLLAEAERFPARDEDLAFRRLLADCGLYDLFREHHAEAGAYTWFDYRRRAFARRRGLRLDYIFATDAVRRRCSRAWIDYEARSLPQPSDHAPVWVEITDAASSVRR